MPTLTLSTNMAAPMASKDDSTFQEEIHANDPNRRNALLFTATGLSVFLGFGYTLVKARRRDPLYFKKMLIKADDFLPENGVSLATKALGVASVLSVTTFGLVGFTLFKICGVNNLHEFNAKLRTYFPNKPTSGRSDFKSLHELVDYLLSEDRRVELEKKNNIKKDS